MALYYSPGHRVTAPDGSERAGAFFDSAIHGDGIPADAVALKDEAEHARLLEAVNDGATIVLDARGKLRLHRARPDKAAQQAKLLAIVRREAATRIEAISPIWRQLNDQRDPSPAGAARFAAIDSVREASNAIEHEIGTASARDLGLLDIANHPLWPETD